MSIDDVVTSIVNFSNWEVEYNVANTDERSDKHKHSWNAN